MCDDDQDLGSYNDNTEHNMWVDYTYTQYTGEKPYLNNPTPTPQTNTNAAGGSETDSSCVGVAVILVLIVIGIVALINWIF